jgi:hypothetical protein
MRIKSYILYEQNIDLDAIYKHWAANKNRREKLPMKKQRTFCTPAVRSVQTGELKCIINMMTQLLYNVYTIS